MPDPVASALGRMEQGYTCSQSVFASFSEAFGLPEELALKLSTPFGGGIARHGHVCGAVMGALLVLGLRYGSNQAGVREPAYSITDEFLRRFRERHDEILCRELTGFAIDTPLGHQAAKDSGIFNTLCPELVRSAAAITAELIAREDSPPET